MSEELQQMPTSANVGAIMIGSSRAVAEAKGKLMLAKEFPRDTVKANAELLDSCRMDSFASVAFYSVPRAGGAVAGPSIRLAEEVARAWGNIEFGHRELSRSEGKSEIEVYAHDLQTNTLAIRQITVEHVIDLKEGRRRPCNSQKEIDDLIANKASKQMRGRILAILPKWLVETAVTECRKTIGGGNKEKSISVRIREMSVAFLKYGVTTDHLEKYLGHELDKTLGDELADLVGVYSSIRDGIAKASEFFSLKEEPEVGASVLAVADGMARLRQSQPAVVEKPVVAEPAAEPPKPVTPKETPKAEPVKEKPVVIKPTPQPVETDQNGEPALF